MTAEAFVREARGFVQRKTRWRHRGRKPWGVDCLGLVELSLRGAGWRLRAEMPKKYGREPWEDRLRKGLVAHFGPAVYGPAQVGDVALIRWGKGEPSHVGVIADYLYGGLSIIHCEQMTGAVETALRGEIETCVIEVYRPMWGDA